MRYVINEDERKNDKFVVAIICANAKDKYYTDEFEEKDMIDVSRRLLSYKPKRGYEFVHCNIMKIQTLI